MTDLTLEELTELETQSHMSVSDGKLAALLAMARELVRIRSALTFLLYARDPDFDFGTKTGDQIELICAKRMGWVDPFPPPPAMEKP